MEKRPIAMKCSSKQFRKITRKLNGLKIVGIGCFDNCNYLINNCDGEENVITNIPAFAINYHKREIYNEWNENIFLEACGIEVKEPKEKTYKITREQIKEIYRHSKPYGEIERKLKECFPEVFETIYKKGCWYKGNEDRLFCFDGNFDKKNRPCGYGFSSHGFLHNDENGWINDNYVEATKQEVTEALSVEIKKRYHIGTYFLPTNNRSDIQFIEVKNQIIGFVMSKNENYALVDNFRVFDKGKWAEIIPTLTIQEAEAKLKEIGVNAKIV